MTIVIINDFAHVNGGASQVAIENALSLYKLGHQVIFFTAVTPIDKRLQSSGVKIICTQQPECLHYENKLWGAVTGVWNRKAYRLLTQLLQKLDPHKTIVHVHIWIKALSASVFKAIAENHFRMVITAHDYFLACPNGGFYNYHKQQICKYHALSLRCIFTNCDKRNFAQKLYRVLRQYIQTQMIAGNQLNLVFVSHFSEEILRHQIRCPYRGKIIYNPIQPIARMESNNCRKEYYVYLGRLSPEKGADLFCEAIYRLGLKGILIGDGEAGEVLKSKYKNYPNLFFAGWLAHDDMEKFFQKCKALIVPSRLYETAVLTIPEVQTNYDIPVIVGDQCAGREFMKKGILFQSGNLQSLIYAVKNFEENRKTEACQEKFKTDFVRNSSVTALVQLYKKILMGL